MKDTSKKKRLRTAFQNDLQKKLMLVGANLNLKHMMEFALPLKLNLIGVTKLLSLRFASHLDSGVPVGRQIGVNSWRAWRVEFHWGKHPG